MNIEKLSERLRKLADLKAEKKRLADEAKANNAEIEQSESEIISAMLDMAESAGLTNADDVSVVVDGRRYGLNTRQMYSIRAEDRDAAFAALRELGLGDLIMERVDERTLSRTMTDITESAGGELPDEYTVIPMQRYDKLTISDRKIGK